MTYFLYFESVFISNVFLSITFANIFNLDLFTIIYKTLQQFLKIFRLNFKSDLLQKKWISNYSSPSAF